MPSFKPLPRMARWTSKFILCPNLELAQALTAIGSSEWPRLLPNIVARIEKVLSPQSLSFSHHPAHLPASRSPTPNSPSPYFQRRGPRSPPELRPRASSPRSPRRTPSMAPDRPIQQPIPTTTRRMPSPPRHRWARGPPTPRHLLPSRRRHLRRLSPAALPRHRNSYQASHHNRSRYQSPLPCQEPSRPM